jgi:hypothetical protein
MKLFEDIFPRISKLEKEGIKTPHGFNQMVLKESA